MPRGVNDLNPTREIRGQCYCAQCSQWLHPTRYEWAGEKTQFCSMTCGFISALREDQVVHPQTDMAV